MPQVNPDNYFHQQLDINRGFFAKCFITNPVLDELYEKLCDLEHIYRKYEKELIKTLLSASRYQ